MPRFEEVLAEGFDHLDAALVRICRAEHVGLAIVRSHAPSAFDLDTKSRLRFTQKANLRGRGDTPTAWLTSAAVV